MNTIEIIKGDILNAKEVYIAHQCNCLTIRSHGLSKTISIKYPWSNIYSLRRGIGRRNYAIEQDQDKPGTVTICYSPNNDKAVICMFGQWAPGKPQRFTSYPDYKKDTYDRRIEWFKQCLDSLKNSNIPAIAFPLKIGCGLAGGNWNIYKSMIERFQLDSGIKCVFYDYTPP